MAASGIKVTVDGFSGNGTLGLNFDADGLNSVTDEGGGSGSIVFQMSDDTNEYVIADAVMIEYVGPPGSGLRASDSGVLPREGEPTNVLRAGDPGPARESAKQWWSATGLTTAEQARLSNVDIHITDLGTNVLGWSTDDGSTIYIDANAAGHGWDVGRGTRARRRESLLRPWTLDPP